MQKVLVSFNLLWDFEYALYKHIYNSYEKKYFEFKFIDDIYIKNIIMFRKDSNPLSKICTELTKDNISKLYKDIMEKDYDEIFQYLNKTDFFNFIDTIKNTNRYEPNVLCKNIKEEQLCRENNLIPINVNNIEKFDNYYSLYFRYFNEVDLNEVQGMNIYFSNTLFNIINQNDLLSVSINNIIRFIDLYNIKKPI